MPCILAKLELEELTTFLLTFKDLNGFRAPSCALCSCFVASVVFGYSLLEYVKRDHCTALWVVQHPSMTPTGFFSVVCWVRASNRELEGCEFERGEYK